MKKLLSICFLSIVLVLAGFTSRVQAQNCCFWLENMQPETLQDISNLGMTGTAALLPGSGNALVLNNTLSPVTHRGQSDVYKIHFNGCNYQKVSFEWKLYRDGQLLSREELGQYADISIYTRYDKFNNTESVSATCGYMSWLGGKLRGDGVCHQTDNYPNRCVGGYPGAYEIQEEAPYAGWGHGYTPLGDEYTFDYFYASFLQNTENIIVIDWKQVGTYSLVIGVRERKYGTDFDFEDNQGNRMGGHQSCCGELLVQDSLHYLVNTASEKSVCLGSEYVYGNPEAVYTQEGQYNVLFGEYVCDHWKVDHIDALSFYTRINPAIVADDLVVCKNDDVTNEQFAALAPAVSLDAPGFLNHKIEWSADNENWSTDIPAHPTAVPGVYTYYVKQSNEYRDSTDHANFWCEGPVATFTMTVLDVNPPILVNNGQYDFCYSELPQAITLKAKLNNDEGNSCADNIHWFKGTTVTGTPAYAGELDANGVSSFAYSVSQDLNEDAEYVFTAYSYDASTETYSTTGVTVKINVWKNPVLVANANLGGDSIVKCPGFQNIALNSNFTSSNFEDADLTWTYSWKKNGTDLHVSTANITVDAPACDVKDVYEVVAKAASDHDCDATISRRFTVEGIDHDDLAISWRNASTATETLYGCDTAALYDGGVWSAPYTINDAEEGVASSSIIKISEDYCSNAASVVYTVAVNTTAAPCSTVVTRSYQLVDQCGNESNVISQVVTIINNKVPTISGQVTPLNPVRPLNNDCKSNLPIRDVLLASFKANFTITTGCEAEVNDDDIAFYMSDKTTVADGNLDIFANTEVVYVYAQVKDQCGNTSSIDKVFELVKPAMISLAHGAITTPEHELCNTDTALVSFDSLMIHNGLSPYTFTWSQTPVPEQCGIEVAANRVQANVWALNGGAYNSAAQFIMTIVDAYGCTTTDTSNVIKWFGIPTVTIVEDPINDDYGHVSPVEVCPTFGRYLLTTDDNANLPSSEDQNLTYVWTGEAIHFTSETDKCQIAVNEERCDYVYTVNVEVTNSKGCKASDSYSIRAIDNVAPVITVNLPVDTIRNLQDCKIIIPDYKPLFTPTTVTDNCWKYGNLTITQTPAPGTKFDENTDVIIKVADICGNESSYTVRACFPEPRISTQIVASVDSSCYPYTTVFSANTQNFVAPLSIYWDGATVAADTKEFTTGSETANLTHNVKVVDYNGCSATASYTLVVYHTPVAADVTVAQTPNHYCDVEHSDGTFTVTSNNPEINGVRLSGTTEWHSLPYSETVAHRNYTFDLRTIHNCVAEGITSVEVERDTTDVNLVPQLSIITDNAKCVAPWSGNVSVDNAQPNYTYYITAGAEGSGNKTIIYNTQIMDGVRFSYLYQDVYTIFATSTFNCHANATVEIGDDRKIPEEITDYESTPNYQCLEPKDGRLTIHNTNSDFFYKVDNAPVSYRGGADIIFVGLSADDHIVSVFNEGTGCKTTTTLNVADSSQAPVRPELVIGKDQYCIGGNGSISVVNPSNSLIYVLGDDTVKFSNTVVFNNLEADVYTISIIDPATNCSTTTGALVTSDIKLPVFGNTEITHVNNTNCTGIPNGQIVISAEAGYTYTVESEVLGTITEFDVLPAGVYTITKHSNVTGCESITTDTIIDIKPVVTLTLSAVPDIDCSEIGTGVISKSASKPSNFSVVDNQGDAATFENLNPGVYTVTAEVIATGCKYSDNVTVDGVYTYPSLMAVSTPNYMCTAEKNGTITITDTTSNKNYTSISISVNSNPASNYLSGLNSGEYIINAISNNHCPAQQVVATVIDSAFVVRDFVAYPNSVCMATASKPGNGKIVVNNPRSSYCDYVFSYLGENPYDIGHFDPINYTIFTLVDGWYLLTITDNVTGCISKDSVEVPFQPETVVIENIATTPDYICTDGVGNGTLTVTATSSSADASLVYSVDNVHFQSSNVFSNLENDEYNIYIKNVTTGCLYDSLENNDAVVEQAQYPVIITDSTVSNTACDSTLYDGKVFVSAVYAQEELGAGSFTYAISGNRFEGLEGAKDYYITITDNATGCLYFDTVHVENDNQYTPQITVEAFNNNSNPDEAAYHFCHEQVGGYMIASATSNRPGGDDFTYSWVSSCDHINPVGDSTDVYTLQAFCCTYTVTVVSTVTGCTNSMDVKVCVDTVPVISFFAEQPARQISSVPNDVYEVCQNKPFVFGIRNTNLQTIEWTNTHPAVDEYSFTVDPATLPVGQSSFCVRIVDNNGCASGPLAANVMVLPLSYGTDTIVACDVYDYVGVRVDDQHFEFSADGENTHTVVDTLVGINTCDSIVTYVIKVNSSPVLNVNIASLLSAPHCAGSPIITVDTALDVKYQDSYGFRLLDSPEMTTINEGYAFDPTANLAESMNGKRVFAYAANNCDTMIIPLCTLHVMNVPTLADQYKTLKNDTLCLGSVLEFTAPDVANIDWHNSITRTVKMQYTTNGTTWIDTTADEHLYPALNDNFKLRFVAVSDCDDLVVLDSASVKVNDTVTLSATNLTQSFCLGSEMDTIVVSLTNATLPATGVSLVSAEGVDAFAHGVTYDESTKTIYGAPDTAGVYSLVIVASSNATPACSQKTLLGTITVKDSVKLVLSSNLDSICLGQPITDVNVNYSNATVVNSSLPVGLSYSSNKLSGTPALAGTYTVKFTASSNNGNECSMKVDSVVIVVKDTVTLEVIGYIDQTICLGKAMDTLEIINTNSNVSAPSLSADLTLLNNKIFGAPYTAGTINYTIIAESNNGCNATDKQINVSLVVKDTVTLSVVDPLALAQTICLGQVMDTVRISNTNSIITVPELPSFGVKYDNGKVFGAPTKADSIAYTITATSNNGCDYTNKTINGYVVVKDTVKLSATNLTQDAICLGGSITPVVVEFENAIDTVVGLPEGVTYASKTISGSPVAAGTYNYTIIATSTCGCGEKRLNGSFTVNDTVIFTAITPLTQSVCKDANITPIKFNVANVDTLIVSPDLVSGLLLAGDSIYGAPSEKNVNGYTYTVTAANSTTNCTSKSLTVTIKVNDKPQISTISGGILAVCDGAFFTAPTVRVTDTNGLHTDAGWELDGETFDWSAPASTDLDGSSVYYVAENACGQTKDSVEVTVYVLPVPTITSDTIVCEGGTALLSATPGYTTYQWYDGNGDQISGAESSSYSFTTNNEGTYKFSVVVTDSHTCTSQQTTNGTVDFRTFSEEGVVTVVVSGKPHFIFTHDGAVTHEFDAATTDNQSVYTWMVSNPCEYNANTLVFVDFDIYYEGRLIPNDSIGEYIRTIGEDADQYVSSDFIKWNSHSGHGESYTCYFNYSRSTGAQGEYLFTNHYPTGHLYGSNSYDDLYLHFLSNRPVTKTFNQFLKAGDYTIEYRLISTSSVNTFEDLYHNEFIDQTLKIGGHGSLTDHGNGSLVLTELAFDAITIHVTGPDQEIAEDPSNDPEQPVVEEQEEAELVAYPSPVAPGNEMTVVIPDLTGNVTLRMVNLSGNVIYQTTFEIPTGSVNYEYTLPVPGNIATGNYFIYVSSKEGRKSVKFMVSE